MAHPRPAHRREQSQSPVDVDVVVLPRDRAGLPDRLLGGEVDDRLDAVVGQQSGDEVLVADVPLDQFGAAPRDLFDSVEGRRGGIREVVQDDDVDIDAVITPQQLDAGVAPDEPGATRHEDASRRPVGCRVDALLHRGLGCGLAFRLARRLGSHGVPPGVAGIWVQFSSWSHEPTWSAT